MYNMHNVLIVPNSNCIQIYIFVSNLHEKKNKTEIFYVK